MGESLCRFAYLKVHSAELGNVSIGAQIFSHIFEGLLKMVETTFFFGGGRYSPTRCSGSFGSSPSPG